MGAQSRNMNEPVHFKFPIGIKILLLIFIVLIAALGTYFWIATHLILGDKKAAIFDYSQTQVTQLRQNMSNRFGKYDADLIKYFKSSVHTVVRSFITEEVFQAKEVVGLFVTSRPYDLQNELGQASGWTLPPEDPDAVIKSIPLDKLQQAFSAFYEQNKAALDHFQGMKVINLSHHFKQLVFGVSKYWRTSQGTLFGTLFFQGDDMMRMLVHQTNYAASLVDDSGTFLISSTLENVFKRKKTIYLPQINYMLKERIDAQTVELTDPKTQEEYLVSLVRLPSTSVYLIHETPLSLAYKPIKALQMRSVYFVIAVLLVSILLALFFSKTITGPIQALAEVASKVKQGIYKISLNLRSRDEIGELNQSFIEMTNELERRRIAIEKEIFNLKMVHESSKEISLSRVTKELIPTVLQRMVELIPTEGVLIAYKHSGDELLFDKIGDVPEEMVNYLDRFSYESDQYMVNWKEPNVIENIPFLKAMMQETAPDFFSPDQDRLALLVADDLCIGFVFLRKNKDEGTISVQDEYLLGAIGTNVSITLRNIELMEETADKARLDNELKTAQLVQQTLLPQSVPKMDKVDLTGFYQPATECGGDWWGFFQMEQSLVVMIGDATGHGAGAALVTAAARSAVSTISYSYKGRESDFSTAEFLKLMNHALYETTRGQILMTFFCACIDLKTGKMRYSNAGHDFPWIYRRSKAKDQTPSKKFVESLVMKGHHIGKQDEVTFDEKEVVLDKGDKLIMFSDGIPELLNLEGDEYGSSRFLRSFVQNIDQPVGQLKETIVQSALTFAGEAKLEDDLTLVLVEYTG